MDWWVAADDRWHDPAVETTVRQVRLGGVPVVETRVRVPQGDLVQRVFAVADHGGITVIEFENLSPMPVAVAVSRRDLLTARAPSDVVPRGIELPADATVHPVGHRSTIRLGLGHGRAGPGPLTGGLPTVVQVVRGWTSQLERASRVVLPEPALAEALLGARAAIALEGLDDPTEDPVAFVLGIQEMVRLGADPADWMPELAGAAELVARGAVASGMGWDADRALVAAARVFARSGDLRAVSDTMAMRSRLGERSSRALGDPGGVRTVAWIEDRLVRPEPPGRGCVLPEGVPQEWRGVNFECHRIPAGPEHDVSYAVRWHGERPAILWEVAGPPGLTLSAGGPDEPWSTADARGEALLRGR
jgi:hypothetical protein